MFLKCFTTQNQFILSIIIERVTLTALSLNGLVSASLPSELFRIWRRGSLGDACGLPPRDEGCDDVPWCDEGMRGKVALFCVITMGFLRGII